MSGLNVKLVGFPQAIRALQGFGEKLIRKHTRIALAAAGGVLKQEAVKRAPTETQTLKKHLAVVTKLSKDRKRAYSVIGAKRRVKVAVVENKGKVKVIARFRTKKNGQIVVTGQKRLEKAQAAGKRVRYRVPSRYIHLAEGRNGSRFLRQTAAAKGGEAAQKAIEKLRQGVEQAAKESRAL